MHNTKYDSYRIRSSDMTLVRITTAKEDLGSILHSGGDTTGPFYSLAGDFTRLLNTHRFFCFISAIALRPVEQSDISFLDDIKHSSTSPGDPTDLST